MKTIWIKELDTWELEHNNMIDINFTCGGFLCSYYMIFVVVGFFTLWALVLLIDKSKTKKKKMKNKKRKDFDAIY